MKQLLLFVCLFWIYNNVNAQDKAEIINWQSNHPEILFIESKDATSELLEKLNAINKKYIVFSNEIQFSDILNFDQDYQLKSNYVLIDGFLVSKNEADYVKTWLATHPDIKIFSPSQSVNISELEKDNYRSNSTLFLSGETITMQDLKKYDDEN